MEALWSTYGFYFWGLTTLLVIIALVWLGPLSWPEQLTRLAQKMNSLGSAAGAKRDRNPFQPHITMYRGCNVPPPEPAHTPSIALRYSDFALFESRQGKRGVSYHILQDWALHRTHD